MSTVISLKEWKLSHAKPTPISVWPWPVVLFWACFGVRV